ncbi:MAG: DUF1934 domain-containing protein [Ruminococcaceae bacterium]|nr:DUF1934 domain-containing protein [Oscillospiraceae bacterium]
MTKRNVMITIRTARTETADDLFENDILFDLDSESDEQSDSPEPTDMIVEGRFCTGKSRVELVYEEGELSGMAGSVTSIGFDRENPDVVSMIRTGSVETALVFEEGKRHFSVYDTPISSFQVGVHTLLVDNRLLTDGIIQLDYLVEIHGAQAEHCRMVIAMRPAEKWQA